MTDLDPIEATPHVVSLSVTVPATSASAAMLRVFGGSMSARVDAILAALPQSLRCEVSAYRIPTDTDTDDLDQIDAAEAYRRAARAVDLQGRDFRRRAGDPDRDLDEDAWRAAGESMTELANILRDVSSGLLVLDLDSSIAHPPSAPDTTRRCRVCGCTDGDACAGGCSWAIERTDPDAKGGPICSACATARVVRCGLCPAEIDAALLVEHLSAVHDFDADDLYRQLGGAQVVDQTGEAGQ